MSRKLFVAVVFSFFALGARAGFAQTFHVGDTVVDGHSTYQLTAIYADGTADITDAYGTFNVPISALSAPITQIDGYFVGETVVDNHASYQISATFPDHTVDITNANGTFNVPTSELSLPQNCWGSACD
jgi:hypothetical protein